MANPAYLEWDLRLSGPLRYRRYPPQLLITDVDNTLYDFGTYFEAGLRGLVSVTMTALGKTEQYVLETLKVVFAKHGSIEYPYALADFPEASAMTATERRELVRLTSEGFWSEAALALNAYPGVIDTLRHLHREGVNIVAFTDAPFHEATRRLRALSIDRYLSGVVATRWFSAQQHGTPALRLREIPGFVQLRRTLSLVGQLDDSQRKPNPETYAQIMQVFGLTPNRVTVIGDSPTRDLAPAASIGMQAIWARYGRRSPASEILLQQIVPYKLPEITAAQDVVAAPFPAVDSFEGLLAFLPTQLVLPLRFG